jgi:hypothetical protein
MRGTHTHFLQSQLDLVMNDLALHCRNNEEIESGWYHDGYHLERPSKIAKTVRVAVNMDKIQTGHIPA